MAAIRKPSLILTLPPHEYAALERAAEAADRDPWQQARHIIRTYLATPEQPSAAADDREVASDAK